MTTFYDKTGLPKSLAWGFIGVLIFMMGDGIEQTWLSRYIASQGLDHEVLFTVYGISVALSAWFSGVIERCCSATWFTSSAWLDSRESV